MSIALNIGFAGAIPDYQTLVMRVAEWLDRNDLTGKVPVYIGLLEARLNRLLRTPDMEATLTARVATEKFSLPNGFLALRGLYIAGDQNRTLLGMSPATATGHLMTRAGFTTAYSIRGRALHFSPPPAEAMSVVIDYFARIPALSQATPSNWLLERNPDIYLYGTLMQAAAEVDDPDRLSLWRGAFDEAIGEVMQAGAKSRWGAGPLVPNIVRQIGYARC